MTFWEMHYGDALFFEIEESCPPKQKTMFLAAAERFGEHISQYPSDETLTFEEYYRMYEK